ncbi:MAG: 1-hydroxycarotenoid 3,4-desaturase CrtD [Caulobacterales bacterium]
MTQRAVIIGAGAGGLAAAIRLAAAGWAVTVLEKDAAPGGKMRQTPSAAGPVDAGPTVFTMRFVFEELFDAAGRDFAACVGLQPLETLARHHWRGSDVFDLPADPEAATEAVGLFAGAASARGFARFLNDSAAIYRTLLAPFMTAQRPGPLQLAARAGFALAATRPFDTLWDALGGYFPDPRLRQLFARYATYCGASPFAAPATLMLIAHVEQAGVWRVTGGMHALAQAMAQAAQGCGAEIRYSCAAREIEVTNARASAVITADGERVRADAIVFNGDASALASGLVGAAAGLASGLKPAAIRSLSALTWTGAARAEGFDLHHHTVFFGAAYRDEFRRIFTDRALPDDPTIYVCAQDRPHTDHPEAERLLILVNAPPCADSHPLSPAEIEQCQSRTFTRLTQAGLRLSPARQWTRTTPADFHGLFPGTGGAIYGAANHGPWAAFQRPAARTKLPGLYLAGGSSHPSAGAPMAALSGGLAAQAILADCASTQRSRPAAISGATSTPSAPTAATP